MSRDWMAQPERGSPATLAFIRWIALRLGRRVSRVLLYPITLYFFITSRETRTASREFLARALDRKPTWLDVFRHHYCFAATVLDRVFLLAGRLRTFDIAVEGADILLSRVSAGRGCILLGAHLGSFEVLRAIGVSERRLPLRVLMRRDHNAAMVRTLDAINPEIARTVIDLARPDATLRVREALQAGALVGVLGDRVAGSHRTARVLFLGGEAEFPLGPMLLASALRVPVILFFGLYRGGRRYELHFELLADSLACERSTRERDLATWVEHYAHRLEYYARSAPFNWFNFYRFWRKPDVVPR